MLCPSSFCIQLELNSDGAGSMTIQKVVAGSIVCISALLLVQPAGAQWPYSAGRGSSSSSGSSTIYGGTTSTYPIGTQTGASAQHFGSPGFAPAPGVSSTTGLGLAPGQFFYYNNPGVGYYRTNPSASQFPAFPAPVSLGGGYYQLGGLTSRLGYWRAPSGYYYPWCPTVYMPGLTYSHGSPIYTITQGIPAPTQPPVGSILADMRQFIEDAKAKKQLDQTNYENVFHRLNDITARASELSAKNGGALNPTDESEIRKQIDLLSAELARSLNP